MEQPVDGFGNLSFAILRGGKRLSSGKITQVIGPVVDVEFAADDKLPEINNALVVYKNANRNKNYS